MKRWRTLINGSLLVGGVALFVSAWATPVSAVQPSSSTLKLHDYGFSSGGTAGSNSSSYSLRGSAGETVTRPASSSTIKNNSGLLGTGQANVPPAPTFTNPSNYYNKLHLVISIGGNPSDTKFAVAISADAFASTTNYVKSDNTVGSTLVYATDYRTYSGWGSGTGIDVIGLASNTTYTVKVKAIQGKFTETGYGPTAAVATVGVQLSLCLYTGANCAAGGSSVSFGSLLPGTVTNAPVSIFSDFATNAASGGNVYIYANGTGLTSTRASYTIVSATADLANAGVLDGFGGRVTAVTQTSGGPLSSVSPYNGASDNVGLLNTTIRELYSTSGPIVGGKGTLLLKAKSQNITPASSDYAATLTFVAAASF